MLVQRRPENQPVGTLVYRVMNTPSVGDLNSRTSVYYGPLGF